MSELIVHIGLIVQGRKGRRLRDPRGMVDLEAKERVNEMRVRRQSMKELGAYLGLIVE